MKNIIASILSLAIILTACSPRLTPFTDQFYQSTPWTLAELNKVQFYLSEDVILYDNQTANTSSTIDGGKVLITKGSAQEEMIFKAGTPGVVVGMPAKGQIAVSFDPDHPEHILLFGPNKRSNNRYVLLAKNWNNRVGEIEYAGKTYLVNTNDAYAGLMFDVKSANRIDRKTNVAGGRKVN